MNKIDLRNKITNEMYMCYLQNEKNYFNTSFNIANDLEQLEQSRIKTKVFDNIAWHCFVNTYTGFVVGAVTSAVSLGLAAGITKNYNLLQYFDIPLVIGAVGGFASAIYKPIKTKALDNNIHKYNANEYSKIKKFSSKNLKAINNQIYDLMLFEY